MPHNMHLPYSCNWLGKTSEVVRVGSGKLKLHNQAYTTFIILYIQLFRFYCKAKKKLI
jgi:hypothetical protein